MECKVVMPLVHSNRSNVKVPNGKNGKSKEKGLKKSFLSPIRFYNCIMVRLAGIEPTTPWFVAKYSIQLSYSRVKRNYSTGYWRNGSPLFPFFNMVH